MCIQAEPVAVVIVWHFGFHLNQGDFGVQISQTHELLLAGNQGIKPSRLL